MVRISLVKNDRKTQIIIEICDLFPSQNVCVCEGTSDILSPHCQKCGWVGGGGGGGAFPSCPPPNDAYDDDDKPIPFILF